MGWMGEYIHRRPTTEELNRMTDDWCAGPHLKILDRSGWMNYNTHQFVLIEATPPGVPETSRIIAVVRVEYSGGELRHRIDDESVGPIFHDCPLRLLKAVEDYPPINQFAKDWREAVRQHHADTKQAKKVLRTLRTNYQKTPQGEIRLVLNDGRTVNYCQGRYRRRPNTSAYWEPQKGARLLQPHMIDHQATQRLWEKPAPKML